jgi:hypothetical protein
MEGRAINIQTKAETLAPPSLIGGPELCLKRHSRATNDLRLSVLVLTKAKTG